MARELDDKVIAGFITEVKGYLPLILEGIKVYNRDSNQVNDIEEAFRYVHTIKGASSMVGLPNLSHIAHFNELILEDVKDGKLILDDDATALLHKSITCIEQYIDDMLNDRLQEEHLLRDVIRIHHTIMALPGAEDDEVVESILNDLLTHDSRQDKELTDIWMGAEPTPDYPLGIPTEVHETFILEAEDHLHEINMHLAALEKHPDKKTGLQEIRRSVHTLKGTAGAVGYHTVSRLAHRTEDLLDLLHEGHLEVDSQVLDLLYAGTEILESLIADSDKTETREKALAEFYSTVAIMLQPVPHADKSLLSDTTIEQAMVSIEEGSADITVAEPRKPSEIVRITLDRLNELVRLVSELVINRSSLEQRAIDLLQEAEELGLASERLRRISKDIENEFETTSRDRRSEFRSAIIDEDDDKSIVSPSTHGFDDLEFDQYSESHLLSRDLHEATSDIRTLSNTLNTLLDDFEGILNRQTWISGEIQDHLMKARLVPLSTLRSRFRRAVRTLARDQNKLIDFSIEGETIGLDKAVLDEIVDPLLHLLRNAVGHGIESPTTREELGKPERGVIQLRAFQQGNQVVIQVSDDGAGLRLEFIRDAAIRNGFLKKKEAQNLTENELIDLILLPDFSTATEVSEVSGRGVGLDIVRANVQKLNGILEFDSVPNHGMTVTIKLPISMAVMQALLVRTHDELFALPLYSVNQILRLDEGLIDQDNGKQVIRIDQEIYPVFRLGDLMNLPNPADDDIQRPSVLLIRAGDNQAALIVDYVLGSRDIVDKTLGTHIDRVRGVSGTTLMGDGSVVLILNPADLIAEPFITELLTREIAREPVDAQRDEYRVMVVDDSLSVRRVVSNLITDAGWHSLTARDGLDALEIMSSLVTLPDLILVDIEMPRMDGYDLMSTLKSQESYRHIPLVVLTSRASQKHRQKALDVGASAYVIKPYKDDKLLETIRHLVQESREKAHS